MTTTYLKTCLHLLKSVAEDITPKILQLHPLRYVKVEDKSYRHLNLEEFPGITGWVIESSLPFILVKCSKFAALESPVKWASHK